MPSTLASLPTQPLSKEPYVYQAPSTPGELPVIKAFIKLPDTEAIHMRFPESKKRD